MKPDLSILGLGCDLATISRVRAVCQRQGDAFLELVYTPDEIHDGQQAADPDRRFAERFAAKEALSKALGTGWADGVTFGDFEIAIPTEGPPKVRMHSAAKVRAEALGVKQVQLTLSRLGDRVLAMAILLG